MSLLLDLLFPRTCVGCGLVGHYLCQSCLDALVYKSIKPPDRLSLFRYHGAIKKMITDLKFNFVSDLVSEITNLIVHSLVNRYSHLLHYWQSNNYVLLPIPLHPSRHSWRGFNQSELICQKLSTELNLRCEPNLLIRVRNTIPQTSIKHNRLRRTKTKPYFVFVPPCQGRGDPATAGWGGFILFDDVYTTGSTIKSAISVFPKNTNIWTLTIAG